MTDRTSPETDSDSLVQRLRGRAQFLRDRKDGVKSPDLMERAADEIERLRSFDHAQCQQEPAAYQFRQRSAIGYGPQSHLPWCDWCVIDRETYDLYARYPNPLVEVRPLYAASPDSSTDRAIK
jgi:hypothetical protein